MKNLITKFALLAVLAMSISSCKKSPLEDVEVTGTGATSIEIAKGSALTSTGTTASSVVTLKYIAGEKFFPNKTIPKLSVYYLSNTQTSATTVSSSVRTLLFAANNVSLTATTTPAAGAPVVTAIGSYGNASNIVWGLTYTFTLDQIKGLFTVSNNSVSNSKNTSLIIVAQDAANTTIVEYTIQLSEFGVKTL